MLPPIITELASILETSSKPFWLGGGYAIDLFLGRSTLDHEDIDFVIKRSDQLDFQKCLNGWDLQAANPPGSGELTPWPKNHFYELPIHNIWGRKNLESPWDLELLMSEFEGNEWVYRRNRKIRGPIEEFGWQYDNLMVIAVEIQLLYKSRSQRPKDNFDFENSLQKMTSIQKKNLKEWIIMDSGEAHPWLGQFK